MPVGAISAGIGAVGSIASAVIGSNAASDAASEQAKAAKNAIKAQQEAQAKQQALLQPYMNMGTQAMPSYLDLLGLGPNGMQGAMSMLQQTPGYNWAFQQGTDALNRGNAGRGLLSSGAQVAGAQQYGQGLASQLYQQMLQNFLQPIGIGENAAAGVGNGILHTGEGVAQNYLNIGQANASGIAGSSNAITGGITALGNNIIGGGGANALSQWWGNSAGAGNSSPGSAGVIGQLPTNFTPQIPQIGGGG